MTREEYYAGIEAYKNKLEHRAMDANAEDTAGKALENWKNQYLNQAINLRAKQYLASKFGRTDDASTYEKQLQILLDKMTNLKGVSLSAKQALMQTIDQTATNKANVQFAKHSDESEDGVLEHGGAWKNHKYIRIENGRYIYEDQKDRDKRDADIARNEKISNTARSYSKHLNDAADEREKLASEAEVKGEHTKNLKEVNLKIAEADRQKANEMIEDARNYQRTANELKRIQNQPVIRDDNLKDQERQRNESAAKAQKEGEAQQRYKDKQEAAAKAAKLSISAWASGETTDKPGKYANEVNELIKSLDLGGDEDFQKQYISEVVKIYDQERDKLPPNVRSIIDKELADLKDRYKPKKIGHSLNLTREEYYAGIEEYKRKKA